jgi:hypothetical protein
VSNYNVTTTEIEIEHGDRYGVEDTSQEERWCETCGVWEAENYECEARKAALEAEEAEEREALTRRTKLICSCGSFTCGAIVRFGLSVPTFEGDIQPIPSQHVRDIRALEIKAAGGL